VVGLTWWSLGIVLAIAYFIVAYRFLFGTPGERSPEGGERPQQPRLP
jgi:hypothetical protein